MEIGKYLSYDEYVEMGGTASESDFIKAYSDQSSKLNYITFGRIEEFFENADTPADFKETLKALMFRLITIRVTDNSDEVKSGIQSYDNGIEKISYSSSETVNIENLSTARVSTICQEYFWKYPELFYRGV